MPDFGEWYRDAHQRIVALVDGAPLDREVAATPGWTVRDVVAHVAGVAHDVLTGNTAGAPGPEWTAAHVARGRTMTLADLLDTWAADAEQFAAFLSTPAGANAEGAVRDVHTHEADLRTALGLPLAVPQPFLAYAASTMLTGFAAAVDKAALPPVTVGCPDVEVFRGRLGRRTVAEVCAYAWSLDPAPYLDTWFVFGRAERSLGERP